MRYQKRCAAVCSTAVVTLTVIACCGTLVSVVSAAPPYTLHGIFPGSEERSGDISEDLTTVDPFNEWAGKPIAIQNTYAVMGEVSQIAAVFTTAWERNAVPMLSYAPLPTNSLVAARAYDSEILADAAAIRSFVSGPDGEYGTDDDRRAYIRLAWEGNWGGFTYSPCNGGPTADTDPENYRRMWQHVHRLYTDAVPSGAGMDSTRLAWVFSIAADLGFTSRCRPENLYPGRDYVDWLGMDGYRRGDKTASQVFGPTALKLRTIDPTKPLSINETGSGAKGQYIDDYFGWIYDNDVRMALWFNVDWNGSNDAVFAGATGNETFNYCRPSCENPTSYRAWKEYREALVDLDWVISANAMNPRLLTDEEFLGECGSASHPCPAPTATPTAVPPPSATPTSAPLPTPTPTQGPSVVCVDFSGTQVFTIARGTTRADVPVVVKNCGTQTWNAGTLDTLNYRGWWYNATHTQVADQSSLGTALPQIAPGQQETILATVRAPECGTSAPKPPCPSGTYYVQWDIFRGTNTGQYFGAIGTRIGGNITAQVTEIVP